MTKVKTTNMIVNEEQSIVVNAYSVAFKNEGTSTVQLFIGQRNDHVTLSTGESIGWDTGSVDVTDETSVYVKFGAGTPNLQVLRTIKIES